MGASLCAGFMVLRSTHRTDDVSVNTASQRKGMCEARKMPSGQSPNAGKGGVKNGRVGEENESGNISGYR